MAPRVNVQTANSEDVPRIRAFLERYVETSLFLLSNLEDFGVRAGESLNSANFKYLEDNGELIGVFALTRRGNLIAETGGRFEYARTIFEASAAEPFPLLGVLGEWRLAEALWKLRDPALVEKVCSREILYRLPLGDTPSALDPNVRLLVPSDFDDWSELSLAFQEGQGIPVQSTLEARRANFEQTARARRWWGYFEGDRMVAMVALNAVYRSTGQVGGVYTTPERRRQGHCRAAMRTLMADSQRLHGLERLILFTGQHNVAARALYESQGFREIGEFGMMLGIRP